MRVDIPRTKEGAAAATEYFKTHGRKELTSLPLVKDYGLWSIVENEFPYDLIAEIHHILLLKRRVPTFNELTEEEKAELETIKTSLSGEEVYDCLIENFPHSRSSPERFHVHLIQYKANV